MCFKPPNYKHLQGAADVLLYFKCPATKQMRYRVNAYKFLRQRLGVSTRQNTPRQVFDQVCKHFLG